MAHFLAWVLARSGRTGTGSQVVVKRRSAVSRRNRIRPVKARRPAGGPAAGDPCAPDRQRIERGIYRQRNGNYAVCVVQARRVCFRTIGTDLDAARAARQELLAAARRRELPLSPRTLFKTVASRWLEGFETMVAAEKRRQSTLDAHNYHLKQHILPLLGRRRISALTVEDIADWLVALRSEGYSEKTRASALATLRSILRYAHRHDWIVEDPAARLTHDERPRPVPRGQRALGREQIAALLDACSPTYRPIVATALGSGMRISEALGLVWGDIDLEAGVLHVRKQLSVPRRGEPGRRVPTKTKASVREIPLADQLVRMLAADRDTRARAADEDWVFASSNGSARSQRNVVRRGLRAAARKAGIDNDDWPPLRFHDLRHTFASHMIIDGETSVPEVSRILGHAHKSTTLDIYTHLFDHDRHTQTLRERMSASAYAALLEAPVT